MDRWYVFVFPTRITRCAWDGGAGPEAGPFTTAEAAERAANALIQAGATRPRRDGGPWLTVSIVKADPED